MIALLVVVLAFICIGLAVVALAMRSGRRPTGRVGRGSQRVTVAGVGLVTLAFGIGLPVIALAYNGNSESRVAPGGIELTAAQEHGRQVFQKNCSTCHTLAAANAVGKVGPILDDIIPPISGKKAKVGFIENAVTNGIARGNGQMPRGVVDGTDEAQVADFVATAAGR